MTSPQPIISNLRIGRLSHGPSRLLSRHPRTERTQLHHRRQTSTVLQAALDAGLTLPYGCRNGACGACKGKVKDGLVDHGAAQDQALSTADRADGMTLFCCAKPLSDLVLECREVGTARDIPVKIMPCRVQAMDPRGGRCDRAQPQAAGQRAAAVPRRTVHRVHAQGRQAPRLFHRQRAA
jgi:ferredoxin